MGIAIKNRGTGKLQSINDAKNKASKSNIEVIGMGATGSTGAMQSTSIVGYTWQQIVAAKARANAVRVTYYNLSALGYTVDKTTITPSDTYKSSTDKDPTGGAAPINITFSGGASAAMTAGTTALPTTAQSDWVAISPLDRTDRADAYHLWHLRSYIANAGATAYPYQTIANYATYAGNAIGGRVWMAGHQSGDLIATPTGYTANTGLALGVNLEFQTFARSIRVLSIGDSITGGGYASSLAHVFANVIDQAIERINPKTLSYGTIYSHINGGVSSQTIQQVYARLSNLITLHSPDVVVMAVWSPNSGPTTTADFETRNNIVLDAIRKVLKEGAIPILCTGIPQNASSADEDSFRIKTNDLWRKAAAASGYILCDFAAIADGALSGGVTQFASGFSSDGTHPSASGQAKFAGLMQKSLLSIGA